MRYSALLLLICATLLGGTLFSCASDDGPTVTISSACAITEVNLGSLKRSVTVVGEDGKESTTNTSYMASGYMMRIDQLEGRIYNPEPLLYGTRMDSIPMSIVADGQVYWRKHTLNDNEWSLFSSDIAMDMRDEVELLVRSSDGTQARIYTMNVKVRANDPLQLTWKKETTCEALGCNVAQRAAMLDGELVVVGRHQDGTVWAARPMADDASACQCTGADDMDLTTLRSHNGTLYATNADKAMISSTDGVTWTATGVSGAQLLGIGSDGTMYGYGAVPATLGPGGTEWADAGMDESQELWPTECVNVVETGTSMGHRFVVAAGLRDASLGDTFAMVWSKSLAAGSQWIYYPPKVRPAYMLPALKDLQVVSHAYRLVAMGLEYGSHQALESMHVSVDCGVTWNKTTGWSTPYTLRGRTQPLAVAAGADDAPFYVVSGDEVWSAVSNEL